MGGGGELGGQNNFFHVRYVTYQMKRLIIGTTNINIFLNFRVKSLRDIIKNWLFPLFISEITEPEMLKILGNIGPHASFVGEPESPKNPRMYKSGL